LPPSAAQKAVAEALLSLVSSVFIPLLGFLLMAPGDIRRPGIRRVIIIVGGIVQLGVLVWLLVVAWRAYDSLEAPFFINAIAAVLGAVFSGAALWIKR
jgi:hypothetical protein